MRRSPRQVSLAVATMVTLAGALTIATAPMAGADPPDLSNDAGINAYLVQIGVNPLDAVWQRGAKNYAGPSCPGVGWNCVRANAPIVQVAAPLGTNLFYCTGLDCVVVQVAMSGGQNGGACFRGDKSDMDALQVCDITQTNTGNPNSTNSAGIEQNIQQNSGPDQNARQVARITQTNSVGKNIAHIHQVVGQTENAKGSGDVEQNQEAHQAATVNQTTTLSGGNTSNIDQRQNQSQRASTSNGLVTQKQNTILESDLLTPANNCDQPEDAPDPDNPLDVSTLGQPKNQCADVLQNSNMTTGGSVKSTLGQSVGESQVVSKASEVDQDQGEETGLTGQEGDVEQNSSAPDDSDALQDTTQTQTASSISEGVDIGDQFKNTGDPRCCATQTTNPGSTADITQRTNQSAFENGEFSDDAEQYALLQGECNSPGTCHIVQSATVNGETTPNGCTNSGPCTATIVCTFGESINECVPTSSSGD
jgi:hypothetical protein